MPEEDHGSVAHRSLYGGLEWVFDGWHLPNRRALALAPGGEGWPEILRHYSTFSLSFGREIRVPESFVNEMGYGLLREGRTEDALRAFEDGADGVLVAG